jgi:hypothetical protein
VETTNPALKKAAPALNLKAKPVDTTAGLSLPETPSIPSDSIGDYSWLIYGAKKIGKTSLAAQFPDALFFMFEPGAKALSVLQVECKTWEHALKYLDLLEKSPAPLRYKTLVIDTGFEAYQKCFDYICKENNIEYPREDNFGKDWKKISNEFRAFHTRVFALGIGLVVLCHEKLKESMTRTGNKFDMVVPNLSNAADDLYRSAIDNVAWYHYRNRERFLLVKGSDYAMAGVAADVDNRFVTKTGEQVHAIPMGSTAKEAFRNVVAAWNNRQQGSYKDETEKFVEDAIKTSVHKKLKEKK